jgi:hypothetical protein
MSDIKIQDFNKIVSSVFAVAQGPDGKPALLSADKPAGAIAEKFTYTTGKVTKIEFFSTYDPATKTGTLIATKNIRWNGDEVDDIYWT